MKLRSEFTATDDAELFDEYVKVMEQVREWVTENLRDPDNLAKLVSA
jgi:hypothetical protein